MGNRTINYCIIMTSTARTRAILSVAVVALSGCLIAATQKIERLTKEVKELNAFNAELKLACEELERQKGE